MGRPVGELDHRDAGTHALHGEGQPAAHDLGEVARVGGHIGAGRVEVIELQERAQARGRRRRLRTPAKATRNASSEVTMTAPKAPTGGTALLGSPGTMLPVTHAVAQASNA